MRCITFNLVRTLIVLAMLSLFAGAAQADPVVTFTEGGTGATNIMNVGEQFFAGTTNANGSLTIVLRNATQSTFLDFHFITNQVHGSPFRGQGLPFFGNFTPRGINQGIDFVRGGTGTGIAPGTTFTVTLTGLFENTDVRATATIPEPTTLLLLGTGLAGIAIKARKKFKDRKIE